MTEDDHSRPLWNSRFSFLAATIGSAVGLGNIWRFPYYCNLYGGGAYLVMYFLAMFLIGHPILLLELALGQKFQKGSIDAFGAMNKRMRGIGVASVIGGFVIMLYYTVIISWAVVYLVESFYNTIPYSGVNTTTEMLSIPGQCLTNTVIFPNGELVESDEFQCQWETNISKFNVLDKTCAPATISPGDLYIIKTISELSNTSYTKEMAVQCTLEYSVNIRTSIAETHFFKDVQNLAPKMNERSEESDEAVVLALVFVYLGIFLSLCRGIKSLSTQVLITMPLTLFLLIALLVQSAALDGAHDGIKAYTNVKGSMFETVDPWGDAIGQVLFSLGVCTGIMSAYSSYTSKKENMVQDHNIIVVVDIISSFMGGCIVYSALGFLDKIKAPSCHLYPCMSNGAGGVGLAFIAYPEALSQLSELNNAWGVVFFSCLALLGIDSAFSLMEGFVTLLMDRFEQKYRALITFFLCCFGCILGINMFCTRTGLYYLDRVDHYMIQYGLVGIGILECIIVGWFYDLNKQVKQAGYVAVYFLNVSFFVILVLSTIISMNIQVGSVSVHFGLWPGLLVWGICILISCMQAAEFRQREGLENLNISELLWLLLGWHGPEMLRAILNKNSAGQCVKVRNERGAEIVKRPVYPIHQWEKVGLPSLPQGTTWKYDEKKEVEFKEQTVTFYKLVDKPGWICDSEESELKNIEDPRGARLQNWKANWKTIEIDFKLNYVGQYWGFLIKYFIPIVLFIVLASRVRTDYLNPYGGYQGRDQASALVFVFMMITVIIVLMIEPDILPNKKQESSIERETIKFSPPPQYFSRRPVDISVSRSYSVHEI